MQIMSVIDKCPVCGKVGQKVKNDTVLAIVKRDIKPRIKDRDFTFCRNPHCEAGYYNNELNEVVHKDDFKRQIWLKADSDPVIICYCRNIKENEIIDAVIKTGLDTIERISLFVKNSLAKNCKVNNPTGHCCTSSFKDTIKKGMLKREELLKKGDSIVDSISVNIEELDLKINKNSLTEIHNCNC